MVGITIEQDVKESASRPLHFVVHCHSMVMSPVPTEVALRLGIIMKPHDNPDDWEIDGHSVLPGQMCSVAALPCGRFGGLTVFSREYSFLSNIGAPAAVSLACCVLAASSSVTIMSRT